MHGEVPSPESKEETKPETSEQQKRTGEFSFEKLEAAWENFKNARKQIGKDRELNVLNQKITLDKEIITLHLLNPIQVDILNDFRDELLEYLRNELENDHISLKPVVMQQNDKKMIYTNKEKLDHLVEKNPQLKNLKDNLGLDIDF